MPRRHLIRSDFLPYHVTARANNREAFPVPLERLWAIFTEELLFLNIVYEIEPHAFVLMPNHFHLLVTVPSHDIGIAMKPFMTRVSRTVNRLSGRSGHVFGGPYHWSVINSGLYFTHAFKYVYRNPVRAGLSENVEDYPYGTLHGLLGRKHLSVPLFDPRCGHGVQLFSRTPTEWLDWLNRPFPKEAQDAIQLGLRRRKFGLPIDRNRRKRNPWLEQVL